NPQRRCASNRWGRPDVPPRPEPTAEDPSPLATTPQLLRHAAGHRAVGRSTRQRRRAAARPPVHEHLGFTRAFAAALDDPRALALTERPSPEMVRSRVYGILAGSEARPTTTPSAPPRLQAPRRLLPGRHGPGQPADPAPLREPHLRQVPQAAARRLPRPVG